MNKLIKLILSIFGIFLLGSLTAFFTTNYSHPSQTVITNIKNKQVYNEKNKFIQNTDLRNFFIKQIFQDSDKNLWIATSQGLWEQAVGQTTFKLNLNIYIYALNINRIYQDNSKNLWFGTDKGGLWEQRDGQQSFQQNQDLPPRANISKIYQDKKKNLWVGTAENGLWEQTVDQQPVKKNKDLPLNAHINQIYQDNNGNLLVGTRENGLWEQSGQSTFKKNINFPNNINIFQFYQDKSGNLWVGTGQGLWEQPVGRLTFKQNLDIHQASINQIYQDEIENLWIGTDDMGLWERASEQTTFRQKRELFKFSSIKQIFQDRIGNLWIGTANEGDLWEQLARQPTFEKNTNFPRKISTIIQIYQDNSVNLWVGTNQGLWETQPPKIIIKNKKWTYFGIGLLVGLAVIVIMLLSAAGFYRWIYRPATHGLHLFTNKPKDHKVIDFKDAKSTKLVRVKKSNKLK